MSKSTWSAQLAVGCIALVLALLLPACGGSSGPMSAAGSFSIAGVVAPATVSGEFVDFEVPVQGGCGGPYDLNVVSGFLPRGLNVDATPASGGNPARHHITGYCLQEGTFEFRLQVTDKGCLPFQFAFVDLVWNVGVGSVAIVAATPSLVAPENHNELGSFADVHAIPSTVYGQFVAIDLIVAGGVPPYEVTLTDDPLDPDDGQLPLGVILAPGSASLVGTPTEILPGRPFRFTFIATDSIGNVGVRKLQWAITTPPLEFVTNVLAPAQAGKIYSELVQIASGVPPFKFELVDDVPNESNEDFVYTAGQPPTFTSATGFTVSAAGPASNRLNADGGASGGSTEVYPPVGAVGLLGPMPPEGVFLQDDAPVEASASFSGVPRRAGTFRMYVHAYSTIVPNSPGQHVFGTVTLNVAPADPLQVDPIVTNEGAFSAVAPYASLPELEIGIPYNPDGGAPGLQMRAIGGVPQDAYMPAPHSSQRVLDPGATADSFLWTVDFGSTPLAGVELTSTGALRTFDPSMLQRQGPKPLDFEVTDYEIPSKSASATATISVGPDVVIVTHSQQSWTGIYNYYSYFERHEPNDNQQRIRKFQALSSAPIMSPLDDTDLTVGTTLPAAAGVGGAANELGALLSGTSEGDADLDLLRCTINPSGWWDDTNGLNVNGARPFQHSDPNSSYPLYGQNGPYYYRHANWQPSCSAVDLPDAQGVVEDKDQGIYADGGRCYHFESDNRFGVFIIRSNASIYVPFAMEKSNAPGEGGFGDGIFESKIDGQQNGLMRTVQMTVSPDGRIAAMKLKQTPTNQLESSGSSRILLFSLTGEKIFGGQTYRIVDPGGAATGSTSGRYVCANSLVLTNSNLYFLMATQTSTYLQSWSSYYIMRYGVNSGAAAAHLLPQSDGTSTNWQAPNQPIQTVFQHWYLSPYRESVTTYGSWPYHRYWWEDGANFRENALAPLPFRVSRNGMACAILAGPNSTSSLSTTVYRSYLWVDYDGSGVRQATSTLRHATAGGGRGYSLGVGPNEYGMWLRFTGPTTGLEISDDGLRVAFTYTNYTGSFYASASATSSSHTLMQRRQDVVCCSTTAADRWATLANTTQKEVTASAFGGSHRWRFGALVFTADNDGLLFWGGAPATDTLTNSYVYQQSLHFTGTMYSCSNLDSTTSSVRSTCTQANGGSPENIQTYTSGSGAFNPSATSGLNDRYGTLQPFGGFLSRNRNFLYICDLSAVTASANTGCQLVGWNISRLGAGSINGHTNGQGFRLTGWPTRRGFIGNYAYPGYCLNYSYGYAPAGHAGGSRQVMARDTGDVFWGAQYQYAGPYTTTSTTFGGPVHATWGLGCYGYGGTAVFGFNADLGGAVAALHDPSWAPDSTGTQERLHYLEVSDDGSKVAYVTSAYYYYSKYDAERVQLISNISFNTPNGSLHGAFDFNDDARRVESSNGRAGESMALIPNGTDMYYAYKSGAGNETSLEMVKVKVEPDGSTTKSVYGAISARLNVLFAGR